MHRRVGRELVARLDVVELAPSHIVEVSVGAGGDPRALARRYRRSRVTAVNLTAEPLPAARRFSRVAGVVADPRRLPFGDDSAELILSNLALPWLGAAQPALEEFSRVLAPGGLLQLATLGPDSFRELRAAWAAVDDALHVAPFMDMHDIGDMLLRSGFADPVMDVERITLSYARSKSLWSDLSGVGARNTLRGRPAGLTTPRRWRAFTDALEASRGGEGIELTLEIVYGHAWRVRAAPREAPGEEFRIAPGAIRRRR